MEKKRKNLMAKFGDAKFMKGMNEKEKKTFKTADEKEDLKLRKKVMGKGKPMGKPKK